MPAGLPARRRGRRYAALYVVLGAARRVRARALCPLPLDLDARHVQGALKSGGRSFSAAVVAAAAAAAAASAGVRSRVVRPADLLNALHHVLHLVRPGDRDRPLL